MTDGERYEELASKWLDGTITAAEKAEFSTWYHAQGANRLELPSSFAGNEEELRNRMLMAVRQRTMKMGPNGRRAFRPRGLITAASVLLIAAIGLYLWRDLQGNGPIPQSIQRDIEPGRSRATLTLADGRTIELSGGQEGIVMDDDITYVDGGAVLTDQESMGTSEPGGGAVGNHKFTGPQVHKLTTPKGGQYHVVLPDGSKVWLNSASSLRYPSKFEQHSRAVELDGEAYFDIAPRFSTSDTARIPFVVKTRNQKVEVLGTQFNINAYQDEPEIRTTLVEGKVRIARHGNAGDIRQQTVLRPGEQAVFPNTTNANIRVRQVDVAEFTAWRDGYFYFNDADIYAVTKQLSRWYDVEVRYEIKAHSDLFVGKIPRDVTLTTALKILKSAGVNFELKDRLLVVLPNND